jgi:ribonuclease HI
VQADHGAITIFFDISKAYDRVIPEILLSKLRTLDNLSQDLYNWVANFLTSRTFQVRLGGFISTHIGRPSFGLPQGSPLSVVLWQIFLLDLPIEANDNLFMDDITFNIDEPSYEEAEDLARLRLEELDAWAKVNGVIFDRRKTQVLVHEPEVEVRLKFSPSDISYLPQVPTYKYLGVRLSQRNGVDLGFSLNKHFKHEREEFKRRMLWVVRLNGSELCVRRTAYVALVRSKLEYALPLTIRNFCVELEGMQDMALRTLSGALRSTPGIRLRNILHLPSILDIAKMQALRTWGKMHAYESLLTQDYYHWIQVEEGANNMETPFGLIQSVGLVDQEELFFPPYIPLSPGLIPTLSKVICSPEMPSPGLILRLKALLPPAHLEVGRVVECYCDGGFLLPKNLGSTGFLMLNEKKIKQGSAAYWPVHSSYHSEKLALRDLLESMVEEDNNIDLLTDIRIFTDLVSLIRSIKLWATPSTHRKSPLTIEILQLMNRLICRSIQIQWIPGHADIPGNEYVDSLASKALSQNNPKQLELGLDYVNFRVRRILADSWDAQRRTPEDPDFPDASAPADILHLNHYAYKLLCSSTPIVHKPIIRLLTNHYRLQGCHFRHMLQHQSSSILDPDRFICRYCSLDIETSYHVVDRCPHPLPSAARAVLQEALLSHHTDRVTGIISPSKWPKSLLLQSLEAPDIWPQLISFFDTIVLPV